jgi:hypothetical protein
MLNPASVHIARIGLPWFIRPVLTAQNPATGLAFFALQVEEETTSVIDAMFYEGFCRVIRLVDLTRIDNI